MSTKPQTLLALNWKMNKTPTEAAAWAKRLQEEMPETGTALAVMVGAITLSQVASEMYGSTAFLGAQDISQHESGAYTGETSAVQLKDVGVKYVIVGHSERREYHLESDATVAAKAKKALEHGIVPIVCVGEKLEIREAGSHAAFTLESLKNSLQGVVISSASDVVIAYEPVWAIGTGKTATAADAEEMASAIRGSLEQLYPAFASQIVIQYGGSVKPDNIQEICGQPNVNGALVGGAALVLESVFGMLEALK
jgi:triosephosphate isomerase (TIM)